MKRAVFVASLALALTSASAQDSSPSRAAGLLPEVPLILAADGRTDYQIVVGRDATEWERKAAWELGKYLRLMSGVPLPVVTDEAPVVETEVLVGRSARLRRLPFPVPFEKLGEDGFWLKTAGRKLLVAGGSEKGVLYGAYTLLEDYLGCRKYSATASHVPRVATVRLEPLDRLDVPFFEHREVHMPDAFDDEFADWHKLDNSKVRGTKWGLWVHTFRTFVPPERYFRDHPEYFAEVNGERIPTTQLCLSQPDVLRLVIEGLRDRMRGKPEAVYWSVSQNDTYYPCQCAACRALDERYRGPSGTLLFFVNQVARAFPDKVISTLAYQYSRQAPAAIRPEPNVNIMLCTIECNRSRPLATDPSSADFVRDIGDWRRLTENIILWDYVVQFRNYCDPFPNLRVLQPNIRFFRDHGVRLMFQQGSGRSRSEFHELRTYLIAKLLWNPDADVDALTDDFLGGFYGPAGPFVRQYLDLLHDSLERSGGGLGIYGYPWDGAATFLTPGLMDRYAAIFDRAEEAARAAGAESETLVRRVRTARLPLEFAALEIAKRNITPQYSVYRRDGLRWAVNPGVVDRRDRFVEEARRLDFLALDESGTSPEDYRRATDEFFAAGSVTHVGLDRPVQILTSWSPKYPVGGPAALTDGLKGTRDFHCNWLGFEGAEMEAVVDLGAVKAVKEVSVDFIQDLMVWIFLPRKVEVLVSRDGVTFSRVGEAVRRTPERAEGPVVETFAPRFAPRAARYVKVRTSSFLTCPPWHKGAGGLAWIFSDEIVIR